MKSDKFDIMDDVLINAIKEDVGNGDITTSSLIPENLVAQASLIAKENFVLAGMPF
jgi:nicotinate-nucleotide pyrophosphorylase (carboxylating)